MKPVIYLFLIVVTYSACSKKTYADSSARNNSATRTATYREKVVVTSNLNADMINEVNAYRTHKGLAPLRLLTVAASEAIRHSQDMASKKVSFGHTGFKQRAIAIANQLNGTSSTGENVAYGKMTAKEVVAAWLKSPAHRANIEGPFTYTGAGVAKDSKGVVYYTQLFVKK